MTYVSFFVYAKMHHDFLDDPIVSPYPLSFVVFILNVSAGALEDDPGGQSSSIYTLSPAYFQKGLAYANLRWP